MKDARIRKNLRNTLTCPSNELSIGGAFHSVGQMAATDDSKRLSAVRKPVEVPNAGVLLLCFEKSSCWVIGFVIPASSTQVVSPLISSPPGT